MVPSSAKVPCMIGKAKSRGWKEPSASWSPGRAGSTTRCTACAGVASSPSSSAASRSAGCSQRPSRAMPTGMTSYWSRSSIAATKRAEAREISCSAERPPKIRASCSMAASLSAAREGRKFGDASHGAHRGAHQTVEKGVQVLQLVEGVGEGRHLVEHERVDEDVTDRATQAVQADHELAVIGVHRARERVHPAPPQLLAMVAEDERERLHEAARRAMRAAVAPAPMPLSMLTTTRPGLQLWSMPSRAASPRPPRP